LNTIIFLMLFYPGWASSLISSMVSLTSDPMPGQPVVVNNDLALRQLQEWLNVPPEKRQPIGELEFSQLPLSAETAVKAEALIWEDYLAWAKQHRAESYQQKKIEFQDWVMPYELVELPDADQEGQPKCLFISMHGGGETAARVNDSQWRNQIRLAQAYQPKHAIYIAPRAPTNTWNLWHQSHVDVMFSQLISDVILFENIDPNRVYLMGYSAGGDGVYQLAPRMADRLAGAAMMAGHPNDASPLGLRNLPYTIHVGQNDTPFKRNQVARDWQKQLEKLQSADPEGYVHWVQIHEGKGHWMELQDKSAIPWMQQFTRQRFPQKIVWSQGNVRHHRFYWLTACPENSDWSGPITATIDGPIIDIQTNSARPRLGVLLHDQMVDLNQPITIKLNGKVVASQPIPRTIEVIYQTLMERGDPQGVFYARLWLEAAAGD